MNTSEIVAAGVQTDIFVTIPDHILKNVLFNCWGPDRKTDRRTALIRPYKVTLADLHLITLSRSDVSIYSESCFLMLQLFSFVLCSDLGAGRTLEYGCFIKTWRHQSQRTRATLSPSVEVVLRHGHKSYH